MIQIPFDPGRTETVFLAGRLPVCLCWLPPLLDDSDGARPEEGVPSEYGLRAEDCGAGLEATRV